MEGRVQVEKREVKKVIEGRGAVSGKASGYAMVCPESITGWRGIDPKTGIINDFDNINKGNSIKDTILVIPGSKGSNGWSCYFSITRASGAGPCGMLVTKIDSSSAVAAVGMRVPVITDFTKDNDPCLYIKTGDYVEMDSETGTVTIYTNFKERSTIYGNIDSKS